MTENLFRFIEKSPNAYFAAENIAASLKSYGYTELSEGAMWSLSPGAKHFVRRNGSSLIAFTVPHTDFDGYTVIAAHLDSPAFQLKPQFEDGGVYLRLRTEKYGGMNMASWLDRPLSIAGRVILRTANGVESRLVNLEYDTALIPSIAIHLCREMNDGMKYDPAIDTIPLTGIGKEPCIFEKIAATLGADPSAILSHDLLLYNREKGTVFGANGEFIAAPRLDDLECAFAAVHAFVSAAPKDSLPVLALFDSEEVGSSTRQGADSSFLTDVLRRVGEGLGSTESDYFCRLANSFFVSADNAHALHPNHPELSDKCDAPVPNGGVVLKYNALKRYASDGLSGAVFKAICEDAGVPVQFYTNRPNIPGGSTLGAIALSHVSALAVDIGVAQFAMHSAYESAGKEDLSYLIRALTAVYNSNIRMLVDGTYEL